MSATTRGIFDSYIGTTVRQAMPQAADAEWVLERLRALQHFPTYHSMTDCWEAIEGVATHFREPVQDVAHWIIDIWQYDDRNADPIRPARHAYRFQKGMRLYSLSGLQLGQIVVQERYRDRDGILTIHEQKMEWGAETTATEVLRIVARRDGGRHVELLDPVRSFLMAQAHTDPASPERDKIITELEDLLIQC